MKLRFRPPLSEYHRDILRIPESHALYISPPGCGRRHALRALENGLSASRSFYILDQTDVISGAYEADILEIVAELFDQLPRQPRVLVLYFNCIDDLLGTDEHALIQRLSQRFGETRFVVSRINPIANDDDRRRTGMQSGVYDLLEFTGVQDGAVNILGRFDRLPADSEFTAVLRSWGVPEIRSVAACETFEDYLRLADSSLDIVTTWMGERQAACMAERLGIPSLQWKTTYDIAEMTGNYEHLQAAIHALGIPYGTARDAAILAVEATLASLGEIPLIVDSLATFHPFTLAENLLGYGFDVVAVLALHMKTDEEDVIERLKAAHPGLCIVFSASDPILIEEETKRRYGEAIAIGHDAAMAFGCSRYLDMFHDGGYFGFRGIERLMRDISLLTHRFPGGAR